MSPAGAPPPGPTVAKLVQICASQNDLFALDEEGQVHQYNFTARTWEKLVASRTPQSPDRSDRGPRGGGAGRVSRPGESAMPSREI